METIVVTVNNVKVFESEDAATVQISFNEPIKGLKLDEQGNTTETDVTSLSIFRSKLTAQLCEANDDIALYRATQSQALNQKQFGIILVGAKLKINREFKAAGETDGDYTFSRDSYITDVIDVTLTERAIRKLDAACSL